MRKKIALVLCRTLGDCVLIHNLIDGITKKYGDAEIDVYVDEAYKDVVFGNPKISKIFAAPFWLSNWGAILKLITGDVYDDVLIPQQLHQEDTIWHQLEHLRHQHLVDYYLTRSRLPKRSPTEELQLYISEHDIGVVDKILEVNKLGKYVVVHTTSGVPTKDWDKFPELVHNLIKAGISVVQIGSLKDKDANTQEEDEKFFDTREKLTLSQAGALCKKAICFVGLDSGLSFIAAATKTPTIVLQGSTVPETSGPWGKNVINILSTTLPQCEEIRCHTNCRYPKTGKCINNIEVVTVLEAIKEVGK